MPKTKTALPQTASTSINIDLDSKASIKNSLIVEEKSSSSKPTKKTMNCCKRCCNKMFAPIQTCPRTIHISGKVEPKNYVKNKVRNVKYNFLNFLPIFLYNQFKFFFNLFFLLITITQFFPQLQIGFLITYIGPLGLVIFLSLLKEIYDECKKASKDREFNSQKFTILQKEGEVEVLSGSLKAGQIVKLIKDKRVPADCLL